MKILLKVVGGLALLVLVLILVGFVLPRSYRVERSVVINARPDAILAEVFTNEGSGTMIVSDKHEVAP